MPCVCVYCVQVQIGILGEKFPGIQYDTKLHGLVDLDTMGSNIPRKFRC